MTTCSDESLYKALQELAIIDTKVLQDCLAECQTKQIPLDELLVQNDVIDRNALGRIIGDLMALPFIDVASVVIPNDILTIIPERVAKKNLALAFAIEKNTLQVATSHPDNPEFFAMVRQKTDLPIALHYALHFDIIDSLMLYRKALQQTFDEMFQAVITEAGTAAAKEVSIANLVDTLITYASQNKASDIHIEPEEDESIIRFRVDGMLSDVLKLPKKLHDQIIARIKVLSKLRTDEHLSAQDGKMQAALEAEKLDIRVSIVPIVNGEKAVLRLLSEKNRQFSLSDLGMAAADLEKVKNGFEKPYGMVLSTGPTGSGKTTTMYAILKILNTREKNISTIEDPVEYEIEGVNQIQVNPKTNLTFADGLRSILRQDPNIIFVGEVRDQETAGIALNSAMTGHLVLSTLHTNDAATSLPRLLDMDIEPFLVASTVNVIIAQRLVRKICQACKVSYPMTIAELSKQLGNKSDPKVLGFGTKPILYKGKGCAVCHTTGYAGRIGLFEVLEVSEAIKQLIIAKADAEMIAKKAIEEGMTTMTQDGYAKVKQGLTTIEEVMRATAE